MMTVTRRKHIASALPNEIWVMVFSLLGFIDLFSAYRVNRHWRTIIPHVKKSDALTLFTLMVKATKQSDSDTHDSLTLARRQCFVNEFEGLFRVTIPELYRSFLTGWPSERSPPGLDWPHALVCERSAYSSDWTGLANINLLPFVHSFIVLDKSTRSKIQQGENLTSSEWQSFSDREPLRHITDAQNEETLRFFREYEDNWTGVDDPSVHGNIHALRDSLEIGAIRLSHCVCDGLSWEFRMILDGPAKGQVHAWGGAGGYKGFEAMSFVEWKAQEWTGEHPRHEDEMAIFIRTLKALGREDLMGRCSKTNDMASIVRP